MFMFTDIYMAHAHGTDAHTFILELGHTTHTDSRRDRQMIHIVSALAMSSITFGTSLKGALLPCQQERSIFSRACMPHESPCAMQHWWSGGAFDGYGATRVRYYVDGTAAALVDLPLGLAHGMATKNFDDNAPWSAGGLFGRSGSGLHAGGPSHGSGLFNNFQVPFASHINVSVSLGCTYERERFWLIVRGRTKAHIVLPGGLELPSGARLMSFERPMTKLPPYGYLPFLNVSASGTLGRGHGPATTLLGGAVLSVTLAVQSSKDSFEFLEGCVRGSNGSSSNSTREAGNNAEWLLSSGTEDYFLGTFYFDRGQYFFPLAGVTSLCPQPKDGAHRPPSRGCTPAADGSVAFSAYRIHAGDDPLMFESEGLQLRWRNGEPGHGGAAASVNASSFGLVYVWGG